MLTDSAAVLSGLGLVFLDLGGAFVVGFTLFEANMSSVEGKTNNYHIYNDAFKCFR